MQEVQTFRRLGVPDTTARTVWMLGFQRRRVRRCECEMLLPKPGLLPHTSQTEATAASSNRLVGSVGAAPGAMSRNRNEAACRAYPKAPLRANRARGRTGAGRGTAPLPPACRRERLRRAGMSAGASMLRTVTTLR